MAIDHGPPDDPFQRELDQLAVIAVSASAAFSEANRLPDDFPIETVTELCQSLAGLRRGTGRNAGTQLEICRAMLPRIRREHFFPEDLIADTDEEDGKLIRGMILDQKLTNLIASVTTALDEYRHQLQSEHDDHIGVEEEGELPEGQSIQSLNFASAEIIAGAADLDKELEEHGVGQTIDGDILRRRVSDSANLSSIARAQLHMRPVVKRWLRATGEALQAIPGLIVGAAKVLRAGVDVAEPYLHWLNDLKTDAITGFVKQIKGFTVALEESGKRLGKYIGPKPIEAARQRDPEIVAAEAGVRRMLLSGVPLPPELAAKVQILKLSGKDGSLSRIARPEDLRLLTNLTELKIFQSNLFLEDLVPLLTGAKNLRVLGSIARSEIPALGNLTTLTSLSVQAHQISDISALGNLTALTSLTVQGNQISDISALGTLTALTSLSVHAHQSSDISALSELTALTSLTVQGNQISDISALSELTALTSLTVQGNQISDISALGKLIALTSLSVQGNQISDISALGNLTALEILTLQTGKLAVFQIGKMPTVRTLQLISRNLNSLDGIEGFTELREILLANATDAIDLRRLEACANLLRIRLSQVTISHYGKLRDLVE